MTLRKRMPSILIYTITILILLAIILFIQPRRVIEYLITLGLLGLFTLFLLLLLLYTFDMTIRIYRWKILLIVQGINLPFKSLILPVMSALAINLFTIARAGETVRMYALKRKHEVKYSDTLSSIVIEQVLSIVGLFFVITVSLFLIGNSLIQSENSEILQQIVLLLLFGSTIILLVLCLMLIKPEIIAKFIGVLPEFLEKRLYSTYTSLSTGLNGLRVKPFHLFMGILTSVSVWIIEGFMIYLIAITVFPSLELIDLPWVIAASCAGNITFIIPILPGAMGEYEVVLAFILANSPNYPGTDATLIALIDRVTKSLLLGLFGGYSILKLGGGKIFHLGQDVLSISENNNEFEKEKNIDSKMRKPFINEENNIKRS